MILRRRRVTRRCNRRWAWVGINIARACSSNIVSHRVETVISIVSKHLHENLTFALDLKLGKVGLS